MAGKGLAKIEKDTKEAKAKFAKDSPASFLVAWRLADCDLAGPGVTNAEDGAARAAIKAVTKSFIADFVE
jgi:hypothetical protein